MLGVSPRYLSGLKFSYLRSKSYPSYISLSLRNLRVIMDGCLFWALTLNSILIVIVNPSLLNPGPTNYLKVASFNTQGLLPFSQLNNNNPTLDTTKLFELFDIEMMRFETLKALSSNKNLTEKISKKTQKSFSCMSAKQMF